jgi:hypothetical protein
MTCDPLVASTLSRDEEKETVCGSPLASQTRDRLPPASWFAVFSMAYTDSGRLLPLLADSAEINFVHIL